MKDLNFPLLAIDKDYLTHDSFADCSGLAKRSADWLLQTLITNPDSVIGEASPTDLQQILKIIKSARTISKAVKKTFGLYL